MTSKTAIVTGASSGIGRATALLLLREGFEVFAGVRKTEDGLKLQQDAGSGLIPLILDVTDSATIQAARKQLTDRLGERGLDGLVNVAGIGVSGPLEYITQEELHRIFEVNVFGQIAVTQAFLPLLHKAKGRIVNISSVGAHIAIPFGGALCSSKSAFGLLSDSLRLELHPFGISVSVIEPGAIHTPAVDKTLGDVEGVIRSLPPDGKSRYGKMLRTFTERAYAREAHGSPPEVVAQSVRHALTARRPKIRYVVGKDAKSLTLLPRLLPENMLDGLRWKLFGMPTHAG